MFISFFNLEDTLNALFQGLNDAGVPTAATGTPVARIYGPSGFMYQVNATSYDSGNITGVWQATRALLAADGFGRGNYYVRFQAVVSGSTRAAIHSFIIT